MDPRAAQKAAKKKAQKAAQRQQANAHEEEEEERACIVMPSAQQPPSAEGPSPAVRVSRLVFAVDDEGEAVGAPAEALTHEKVASLDDLVGRRGRHRHAAVPAALVAAAARVVGFGSDAPARPTRVQAEVWARALCASPPDMVAVSATGSGKTLAFLMPALVEAAAAEMAACECGGGGNGPVTPRVLVLAPTRELALQTDKAALSLEPPDVRVMGLVGGVDFHTQRASLLSVRPTLVVATVGRLLGHCGVTPASTRARQQTQAAEHATDTAAPALALHAVTLWVLDEADRLLDLGFADDLHAVRRLLLERSAATTLPPQEDGAQREHDDEVPRLWCMMFSATWSAATRTLAAALLSRRDGGPLQIHVGESDLAGARTIEQRVELVQKGKGQSRFRRLCGLLREFGVACTVADDDQVDDRGDDIDAAAADSDDGVTASDSDDEAEETSTSGSSAAAVPADAAVRVLVFVVYKKEATHVANGLCEQGFAAEALQGDMSQRKRSTAMQRFRDGSASVLVATDVAARGLDVAGVDAVINYSLGGSMDTYVHRIGRCGRAGRRGVAHTLVTVDDLPLLPALVEVLRRSRQAVPRELQDKATTVGRQTFRKDGEGRTARVLTEEEEELREQQIANRAKQLAAQQAKQAKAHKEQRKSKHGRGRK